MMSQHFRLRSELTRAIAKRLPLAKNQPSGPDSFLNQFVTDIYIWHSKNSRPKSVSQMGVKIGYFRFVHCIP